MRSGDQDESGKEKGTMRSGKDDQHESGKVNVTMRSGKADQDESGKVNVKEKGTKASTIKQPFIVDAVPGKVVQHRATVGVVVPTTKGCMLLSIL